jgi:hypothetical protein
MGHFHRETTERLIIPLNGRSEYLRKLTQKIKLPHPLLSSMSYRHFVNVIRSHISISYTYWNFSGYSINFNVLKTRICVRRCPRSFIHFWPRMDPYYIGKVSGHMREQTAVSLCYQIRLSRTVGRVIVRKRLTYKIHQLATYTVLKSWKEDPSISCRSQIKSFQMIDSRFNSNFADTGSYKYPL